MQPVDILEMIWHNFVIMMNALVIRPTEEEHRFPDKAAKEMSAPLEKAGYSVKVTNPDQKPAYPSFRPDVVVVGSSGLHAAIEVTAVSQMFPNIPVVVAAFGLSKIALARAIEAGATVVVPIELLGNALANLSRVLSRPVLAPDSHFGRDIVAEFHDRRTGQLNASRIAKALDISLAALARSIGVTPSALSKRPTARAAQDGLREIEFSWATLSRLLGSDELARAWLNAAHPDLEGQPPIVLLTKGSAKALADYLRSALAGQPT
jgi:hypothetical protein